MNRIFVTSLLVLLIQNHSAVAQSGHFTSVFNHQGRDLARGIAFGAYLETAVAGTVSSGPYSGDYGVVMYDFAGTELWRDIRDVAGHDHAFSVAMGPSNDTYVTGVSGGAPTVIKYDFAGNYQWTYIHPFSYAEIHVAIFDPVAEVMLLGGFDNQRGLFSLAVNADGTLRWSHSVSADWVNISDVSIIPDSTNDGRADYFFVGSKSSAQTGLDAAVMVIDGHTGSTVWELNSQLPGNDWANHVNASPYFVAITGGIQNGTGVMGLLATLSFAGSVYWARIIEELPGGWNHYNGVGIDETTGNIYVTGGASTAQGCQYDWVTRGFSIVGTPLWRQLLGACQSRQYASFLAVNPAAGTLVVSGEHFPNAQSDSDVETIAYDLSTGAVHWRDRWATQGQDRVEDLKVAGGTPVGGIVVTLDANSSVSNIGRRLVW